MISLIDFILNLFRDRGAAADYVAHPEQALLDAGLGNVAPAQLASVAATAVPSVALGAGDPVIGLQRAVANNWGFEPVYSPSATWAPETDLLSGNRTDTDLASNNNVPLFSPNQDAGANAQNGAFNLGFGDVTLGDKTTASGDGAVAIGDDNEGDILTGDGSALGDNNDVYSGDIRTGENSNVNYGNGNEVNDGTTAVGGDYDYVATEEGTVIQTSGNSSASSAEGNTTVVDGNQSSTTVYGSDNTTTSATTDDDATVVTHTETTTTTVSDSYNDDFSHNYTSVENTAVSDSYNADNSINDSNVLSNQQQADFDLF